MSLFEGKLLVAVLVDEKGAIERPPFPLNFVRGSTVWLPAGQRRHYSQMYLDIGQFAAN